MLSMKQKELILEFKTERKKLAQDIRNLKEQMKDGMRGKEVAISPGRIQSSFLPIAKYEFRHQHIAYCMLRGRTMEEIEAGGDHSRNEEYINSIMSAFKEKFDAAA